MRILLLGKNGQLGKALVPLLRPLDDVIAMGREDLDVADCTKLRELLRTHKPDIVVNASAYTNVDRAESEKDIAWRVNAEAPGVMMDELSTWKGVLIHVSTDYVFDGAKDQPYLEEDALNPINEYGRSKLGGERLIETKGDRFLIVRTGWLYAENSQNFVSNVLRWATTQETLRIVDDQTGSPTWATMLAGQLAGLLITGKIPDLIEEHAGVYHCAGKGSVSRYDLAQKILSLMPSHSESENHRYYSSQIQRFSEPGDAPPQLSLGLHQI